MLVSVETVAACYDRNSKLFTLYELKHVNLTDIITVFEFDKLFYILLRNIGKLEITHNSYMQIVQRLHENHD